MAIVRNATPFLIVLLAGAVFAAPASKKFILCGWELQKATPAQILANADKLAATSFDGLGVYVRSTNSAGQVYDVREIMHQMWPVDAFDEHLPALCAFSRTDHLRESFLISFRSPWQRIAWTNEADWRSISTNMSVLARLACRAGIRGLIIDHEDYGNQRQFLACKGDPAYGVLKDLARQRGREVFGSVFREYPEVRLLFYWLLTANRDYFEGNDPRAVAESRKDLWPSFVDGILDVMPETARLIDGDEHSYWSDYRTRDFHVSAAWQRMLAPKLLSPENRAKHALLVQVSFGQYLDMYANPKGSYWYFDPVDGSRAEHFRRNLKDATQLADEYLWFWGEHHPTVKWESMPLNKRIDGKDQTWDECVPGFLSAMAGVRDADGGLRRRKAELEAKGALVDSNPNAACVGAGHDLPMPYQMWRNKNERDSAFGRDDQVGDGDRSSVVMRGSKSGTLSAVFSSMVAGRSYYVSCRGKGSRPIGLIKWKKGGVWTQSEITLDFGSAGADGWQTTETYLTVPSGVDEMCVILYSIPPRTEKDAVWFDNLHVYRLF